MFFFFQRHHISPVQQHQLVWKVWQIEKRKKLKISIFSLKLSFYWTIRFFFLCFVYILVFFNGLYSFSFLCQVDTRSMLFVLCDNVKDYELKEKYSSNCSRRGCKKNNCGSISSYYKFKKKQSTCCIYYVVCR